MRETAPSDGEPRITGLLSLKMYERPDEARAERNMQNIMRRVREESNLPGFLLFPEAGFSRAFAQPRYGIAALFMIFLALHLVDRPFRAASVGAMPRTLDVSFEQELAAVGGTTNQTDRPVLPGIAPRALYRTQVPGDPRPVLTSFPE